jgi:DNA-directed RNA polymerase subunit RPC12/RpoP
VKYYCSDCSYSGNTSGHAGECPACGSFALVRRKKEEETAPPPKWRLALLIGLWSCLIILVIRKLST